MAKKQTYYRLDRILKEHAIYNLLLGSRATGKSYAVKEKAIKDAYNHKGEFVYLRRYAMDITPSKVVRYFGDMPLEAMTNGEYNEVYARGGSIWLRKYNYELQEVDKTQVPLLIGHYCALVQAEHIKSDASFENVITVIYEEFITNGLYYKGNEEPKELLQLISTIARRRQVTVFLIGNTISRITPYFQSFSLHFVPRMEQGEIKTIEIEDDDGEKIKIAVEFCGNTNYKNKMFFGASKSSIVNGAWETEDEPRLTNRYREYKVLYRLFLCDMGFSFAIELLQHSKNNNQMCIYVYPCKPKKQNARILSTEYNELWNVTPFLNMNNKAEMWIGKCYEFGKIAYSDNLTASDFKAILLNNDKLFKGANW